MASYSVKDVANLLGTSEETVRRWIRSGKLEATKHSNKEGSVISQNNLTRFAQETPKYAGAIAGAAAGTVGGIAVAATLLLGSAIVDEIGIRDANIDSKEVERLLQNKKNHLRKDNQSKKKRISQIEKEIEENEASIRSIEYLLKQIK